MSFSRSDISVTGNKELEILRPETKEYTVCPWASSIALALFTARCMEGTEGM